MRKLRHKTRSVWIDITFSLALILLTCTAAYLILMPDDENTAASLPLKKHVYSPPLETEQIDSNYPGIKIISKISNDKVAPYAIQYPQSIHSSFNEQVSDYITKAEKQFKDWIDKKNELVENTSGELNISYETLTHSSGNYSFVLVNNRSFSDEQNGETEIRSFHLNPETGESYSIFDLLEGNMDHLSKLANLVHTAIKKDPALQGHLHSEAISLYTEPLWKNFRNYAITDEAIIIYFDENTIADATTGPPIISISIDRIADLVADAFKPKAEKAEPPIANNNTVEKEPVTEDEEKESTETLGETENSDQTENSSGSSATMEPQNKKIALTFDDGPDPKVTRQILQTLEKHGAKATFFMLGSRAEYYPDIVKEVLEAGHELGNHTWNHADLTKLNAERISKEINNTTAVIEKVSGGKVEAFRPPYGAVNDNVRQQTNLPVVLWDIDTLDWKHRNAQKLLLSIKQHAKDGSIILMHDIHQSTADGLDAVLTYLESEGYTFVTVAEL